MTIDLDHVPPPSERPVRPVRVTGRPALALVVLLALLLGAAEARPRIPDLPLVASTTGASGGGWLLTGTALYSTHRRVGGRIDVVARSLGTGAVLWQREVEWRAGLAALATAGPLLVMTGPGGARPRILDGRTGEDGVAPGTYTVALPVGDRIVLYDEPGRWLTLYDPAAERAVWQRPFEYRLHAAAATGTHLLTVDDTGAAATFALGTGEPGAITDQAVPAGSAPLVRVLDSRVYLLGDGTVTSVVVPNLTTLWTAMLPLPRVAVPCGTRICVSGGAGVSAIDPETGRVVWNNLDWTGGEGGLVRAVDGHGLLVDPENGEVQADLGPGLAVGDLLLRADSDGLSVVEWATGRIRGRLPGRTPSGCRRTGNHLACQQADGPIKVWRLL